MNKFRFLIYFFGLTASMGLLQSCLEDDDYSEELLSRPTALVTVRPQEDNSFILQLDNTRQLRPINMSTSPFGSKEVRALVNYTEGDGRDIYTIRSVYINWIDSIRTKKPVPSLGADSNDSAYGNDAIEIVRDWVTVAEDGYLTLRIRTLWGVSDTPHSINLLTGVNQDNPYEMELRHDANGDAGFRTGDALIAFNLNDLPAPDDNSNVRIKIKWRSFTGNKSAEFDLYLRPKDTQEITDNPEYTRLVN